jgi:DNA-binding CsgD family transcriptional regulator
LGEELGEAGLLRQFSSAISQIYAAATDTNLWRSALIAVETLTGSTGAVIDLIPTVEGAVPTTLAGSFSDQDCSEYARDYMAMCPRIRFAMAHPGRTQVDYMFMNEAEMDRDAVYDWYGSHGLRYHIASTRRISDAYLVAFSVQRTRRQGHAQSRDVQLFELVKPHLSQALAFAEQLGSLRSFERFSSSVLQSLPQAIFALDASGTILFANAAAEVLLRAGDGLYCADRKLRTRSPSEQHRLDSLIDQAATMSGQSDGWVRVSHRSGGAPYVAFISPLSYGQDDLIAAEARVVVMVHDSADRRTADPRMLMEVYELTRAEVRLANALCGGHSVESAASLLGVQPATLRSQLKSVFRKTGVSRQQDLVGLLSALSTRSNGTR